MTKFFGVLFGIFAPLFPMHTRVIEYSAPPPIQPPAPQTVSMIFAGDIMLDRSVRLAIDKYGGDHIFSCIDPVFSRRDVVVANLEGPITPYASVSATSTVGDEYNMTFTFAPSTAALLYSHNVRMVNLGNNHILNFSLGGVRSTIQELQNAGVSYFGDPIDSTVAHQKIHGIRFAFINYNEFSPAGWKEAASTTISQILQASVTGEIPIVYTHWGIEYATTSPARIQKLAHSFVDAGAEIVVGSHPHVVEEHELYNGKNIYYSLGNFIFDQYWNDAVSHGLLIDVRFGASSVESVHDIPVELLRDRRTCTVALEL